MSDSQRAVFARGQTTMFDKVWHYTVGDDQFGPVTSDELKKLADAGTVKPTDQVWKEGMADWMSASSMKGLFAEKASGAPVVKEMTSQSPPKPHGAKKFSMPKSLDPLAHLQPYGHAVLMIGFLLVVFARGCDSIGNRGVARAKAKADMAKSAFADEAAAERQEIQDQIDDERDSDKPDQKEIDKLQEKLTELRKDQDKQQARLEKGAWRNLEIAARDAAANNAKSGYWHELLFVVGTMAFVVGLITVGFRGEGAEKTICLIMLAIVTVSLYVVGTPWVGSLPGLFGR